MVYLTFFRLFYSIVIIKQGLLPYLGETLFLFFMPENKYNNFRRQTHRLKGFDYSSDGYYYITICTRDRLFYFGEIIDKKMQYSSIGEIAREYWLNIPKHYLFVLLDEFIVMPNHIHGIIKINHDNIMTIRNVATHNCASLPMVDGHYNKFGPQSKNLASIIRGYKSTVKKYANQHNIEFHWQPRYYDRIIRDKDELNHIREYIKNNPVNWQEDRNNPENDKRKKTP